MKKLSLLGLVIGICCLTSVASADLAEIGSQTAPIEIASGSVLSDIHMDADPFKGYASVFVMNTGLEDWTGFKFQVFGEAGVNIENVHFVDSALSGGAMNDPSVQVIGGGAVGHTYVIDNNIVGATIVFDFNTNITNGQLVQFTIGTDNTVDKVNFGLAMIPVVPEPVSLALLGFGGLLIRRRRA